MESPWRQACLLLALLLMPMMFAAFCLGLSRRREGHLVSYVAYFLLFGFVGLGVLMAGLWPSGASHAMRGFLVTGAPAICLGLLVPLHKVSLRQPFDTGALVTCYLYLVLAAAAVAFAHFGLGG